jgi:hypothetical protein
MHDVLGLYGNPPPFSRTFANVAETATQSFSAYAQAVRERAFPSRGAVTNVEASHIYGIGEAVTPLELPRGEDDSRRFKRGRLPHALQPAIFDPP